MRNSLTQDMRCARRRSGVAGECAQPSCCILSSHGARGQAAQSQSNTADAPPDHAPAINETVNNAMRNLVTRFLVYTESEHTLVEERGTGPLREGPYLYQNAPNPLNGSTVMRYALEREGTVRLTIYSVGGQRVLQLVDAFQRTGYHQTILDGRDRDGRALASGV